MLGASGLEDSSLPTTEDIDLTVKQLSRNYDLVRSQITSAFYISTVFMSLGLLVIILGSGRVALGLAEEADSLTIIGGVLSEFISGSALFLAVAQ